MSVKVLYPGHSYQLLYKHGTGSQRLDFVREPPFHEKADGVLLQDIITAEIDRIQYLDAECPHPFNARIVQHYREIFILLEMRALERKVQKGRLHPEAVQRGEDGHFLLTMSTPVPVLTTDCAEETRTVTKLNNSTDPLMEVLCDRIMDELSRTLDWGAMQRIYKQTNTKIKTDTLVTSKVPSAADLKLILRKLIQRVLPHTSSVVVHDSHMYLQKEFMPDNSVVFNCWIGSNQASVQFNGIE